MPVRSSWAISKFKLPGGSFQCILTGQVQKVLCSAWLKFIFPRQCQLSLIDDVFLTINTNYFLTTFLLCSIVLKNPLAIRCHLIFPLISFSSFSSLPLKSLRRELGWAYEVCPEAIQLCNTKNRDIYGRRYKI